MAGLMACGQDHAAGGNARSMAVHGARAAAAGITTATAWQMHRQSVQEQTGSSAHSPCSQRQIISGNSRQSNTSAPHSRHTMR